MQLFKLEKKQQRKGDDRDRSVMFSKKQSNGSYKTRRRSILTRSNKTRGKKKIYRGGIFRQYFRSILKIFLYLSLVLGLLVSSYTAINWVISLRASKGVVEQDLTSVIGFDSVPVFPTSEYVFSNSSDEAIVETFVSSGRSIYGIPLGTDIQSVYDYYKIELPERGWNHIKFVPRTQKDEMYGDYWENPSKDLGLRIYERVNDIWYERLSISDAKQGLSRLAKQEIERELVLASSEGTDLLPDFPWTLKVPVEYVTSYYATDEGELQALKISSITDSREYILEPIAPLENSYPDKALELFVDILNSRSENGGKYAILNSVYNENGELEATVVNGGKISSIAILANERSSYYYGLYYDSENDTFFDFLRNNLRQKDNSIGALE